jgi:type II restriction/modification system DNA methylase subunit YeeA
MPVNTAALKTFAPAMRRKLLVAVGRKLDLLLNSQTPDTLSTYAKQIAELREQEAENREQLLEQVAYTWFNRLCALRYLDAKGWHPFGCKVLMPAAEGETQPELLKQMRAGSLPAALQSHTDQGKLHGLLDGQVQTAIAGADPQGEVYRELLLAVCRSYHQLMPYLFEGLDDATELLLPDDQITDSSIAGAFRSQIIESDCEDVEIIGWLYQFYISEKKDQVIGKVVKSEDIPAATQLFTPNWIVKYMVQNSLGAQWLATYPASALKSQMEYYIEPAEQPDDVKTQLASITPESLNPEELTLIDPACGSGHILVEAYEVFKAIYLERGYQQREIPQLILEKNLYGLDIDERAAQLTSFALMMKGRGDDRRLFERGIKLNVMAMVNSNVLDVEGLANVVNLADHGLKLADLSELKQLFEHSTTFGSLIQVPEGLAEKLPALKQVSEATSRDMIVSEALKCLGPLVRQAEILGAQYDAVVANPPYMGSKGMNALVKKFAKDHFPHAQKDLFACFIERGFMLATAHGHNAMVTMESWMFLANYESFRDSVLQQHTVRSLAHFPYDGKRPTVMGINFGVAIVGAQNAYLPGYRGHYCCSRYYELDDQGVPFVFPTPNERMKTLTAHEFQKIPGRPLAYWVSPEVRAAFQGLPLLGDVASPRQGLATTDNAKFCRLWHEVNLPGVGLGFHSRYEARQSGLRWFPLNKGGKYRKWFGNNRDIVNWEDDGREIKSSILTKYPYLNGNPEFVAKNPDFYFRPGITWGAITSAAFSIRMDPAGFIPSNAGMKVYADSSDMEFLLLGLLNSAVAPSFLGALSQTLNFDQGIIRRMPVPDPASLKGIPAGQLVRLAATDWDAYERSWDFQFLPLLTGSSDPTTTLESSYTTWITQNRETIAEMKRLEEENNRLFIDAYRLQDELTPQVPIEQITLTVNPAYRYGGNLTEDELRNRFRQDTMKEFLSYATGCMMGRYSLDQPGLILADSRNSQAEQLAAYEEKLGKPLSEVQFKPDPDGIIPVLDGEWFEDDIVARTREFLEVTFPESTVTENLRFIEESLGKDIRKYFCTDFYKDHLQTYKKRPIYWLLQSPKKGFSCLIYLHRYTKDTLNLVLNNYFRTYLRKLEARLVKLGLDQLNDDLPARDRTAARKEAEKITKVLKECQAWEQDALLPLAQQRIELDLDDGVKVNYLKLQDVLAPIPGLAAKEE